MNLRFGLDLVQVTAVAQSIAAERARYLARVYTSDELAASQGSRGVDPGRLAEHLAVKKAVLKLLPAVEESVDLRAIELVTDGDGRPGVVLHGRAAELGAAAGIGHIAVSLTRDERLAAAVVAAEIDDAHATVTDPAVGVATTR